MSLSEDQDREEQNEEVLALEAIFGPEVFQKDQQSPDNAFIYTLNLDEHQVDLKSPRVFVVRFFLPPSYPRTDMPFYEICSVYFGQMKVDQSMVNDINRGFKDLFQPGQVVLFEWTSWLREYLESKSLNDSQDMNKLSDTLNDTHVTLDRESEKEEESEEEEATNDMDRPTVRSCQSGLLASTEPVPEIQSSIEPLVDRKSVFVAHVATVYNASQVRAVVSKLLENKKIAKATHNIMAYRIVLDDGRVLQDNDDDGETAAGGRLMHLLQILDVQHAVVVVSRWFGGIMLGADRFKDINNCARKALEDFGHIKDDKHPEHGKSKGKHKKK
ncbi:ribosomal protein S5 domain 2-type protein [Phycomyces nitens]|nr:ribosomal protein S5 domain 2-type protein [Phycomyces nitens]